MQPPYDLVALQAVDLEVDRLERQKVELPALEELRGAVEQRKTVESEHGNMSTELRSLDQAFNSTNGELKLMEERLDIAEKKLFGGGMSSKETENRRLEVESLRVRIDQQESSALDLMDQREQIGVRITEVSAHLEETRLSEAKLGEVVRKAWAEIDAQLAALRSERTTLVSVVPGGVLNIYESLRKQKGGVAAGRLEGRVCGGCHLALSESERAEAMESDPPRCPHCRRILVF